VTSDKSNGLLCCGASHNVPASPRHPPILTAPISLLARIGSIISRLEQLGQWIRRL